MQTGDVIFGVKLIFGVIVFIVIAVALRVVMRRGEIHQIARFSNDVMRERERLIRRDEERVSIPVSRAGSKFCVNCGHAIGAGANFCQVCGSRTQQ